MRFAKSVLVVMVVAAAFIGTSWAQENAELTGSVTDPSGAVVPNAKVKVTNAATGEIRTATTNGDGLYVFAAMHIGSYNLQVEAPGFRSYRKTGIVMNVAATVREDISLQVGGGNQTVTVQANALHLQTETNEVSNLITGQQITQLATNGRNIDELTTLGTGVSVSSMMPSFNGVTAQGSNAEISFNGMRPGHNDFLIDGGEVYDRGSGGKLGVMPSPDALAEFQTLDSNYAPDYGISSGGTITLVLKSGTKTFHGGLWEFNRNDDFDAGSYFSKLSNTPTPELRLNIFGGDVGGPVFIPGIYPKDKSRTFFFVTEEWRKYIQGATPSFANTVPGYDIPTTGAALTYEVPAGFKEAPNSGICNNLQTAPCVPNTSDPAKLTLYTQDGLTIGNSFPGGVIPANLIDPNAVLFMKTGAIPASNTTAANGAPQYVASPRQPTYVREDVVRIDHDITDKLHLMGHWIHDQMSQTIYPDMWSNDSYPTTGDVFGNPSWGSVIKLTQTISPTVLNETSFNVNGNTISITPAGIFAQPSGWTQVGYFPAANNTDNRMPSVDLGTPYGTNWTINYWPWKNSFLDYQPRDDFSWTKGKHALKFGVAYMRNDKNQQQQADTQGDYSFGTDFSGDAYVNFLLGMADSFQQLESIETFHWINNTYSFYGMDNWRLTPRLTLNLGLRYDGLPHVYNKENMTANFVPAAFSTSSEQVPNATTGEMNPNGPGFANPTNAPAPFYLDGVELAGKNGFPRGLVNNDYWTWEPRLGFAYDLFGNGKTVLRAGTGVFYERVQGNDIYGTDTNPPFAYRPLADQVYFSNPSVSAINGQTASKPVFPASMGTLNNYYPNPGTLQYSLGIQHQLAPSVVMAVQYVGSGGWNQDVERQIDTLPLNDITDREAVNKGANANLYRMFPGFSSIQEDDNSTNFNYNSLQAAFSMENKHGLTLHLDYTWAHEIDIQSDDLSGTLSDPFDPKYDRGSGTLDRRNVFSTNYIYNMPFFLHSGSMLERSVLGGWVISGITQAQSGAPQAVTFGPDTLGLGGGTSNRPNLTGAAGGPKTRQAWFNTRAFTAPVAPWNGGPNNGWGNAGKDAVYLPGLENTNLSLFKTFALVPNEGARLEIRFESFNTFNHTEWNGVDTGFTDGNFGEVTSTYDPRELQFGAKFLF
ncbi:MAG TPA: carboxypeptidase regulatory-like domain-containing protein [Acidobacteriaceae bacterium]|nr:carboxypeptidase regulatory-like domain-containing protein [Acidobacteriaceae bacterium]